MNTDLPLTMGWWVADYWQSPSLGPVVVVSWTVWVIGSIVLHELGHGWAAIRLGDNTPRELGHTTWNPLVHMGGFSLLIFAIIGIAWGAMPVNDSRLRGRHAPALVSLAGPAVNLILAVVALLGVVIWEAFIQGSLSNRNLADNVRTFLHLGAFLNVVLMLFNLVPVPPLDGSRIVAQYVPEYRRLMFEHEHGRWVGLGLFVLLFWFGADVIIQVASKVVGSIESYLISLVT